MVVVVVVDNLSEGGLDDERVIVVIGAGDTMSSTGGKRPTPTLVVPAEKERARSSPPPRGTGTGSLVLLSLVGLESLDINDASRFLVPFSGFKALSFFFSLLSLSLLALSFSRSPAMELVRDQREAVAVASRAVAVAGGGGDDKKLLLLVFIVPVGLVGLETLFWFCG